MKTKVLVADDSNLVADTVAALAARFGYRVTACVTSGVGAIEAARVEHPDIALIDLHMGGECSGVELAHELLEQGTCVVFLTALPTELADQIAAEVGVHGLMPKPFGTIEFRQGLECAFARVTLGEAGVVIRTAG